MSESAKESGKVAGIIGAITGVVAVIVSIFVAATGSAADLGELKKAVSELETQHKESDAIKTQHRLHEYSNSDHGHDSKYAPASHSHEVLLGQIKGLQANVASRLSSVEASLDNATHIEVPIGSIIAWHKDGGGVPKSDVGHRRNWMECNGDKVSDPDSLLDGTFLPDLNGAIHESRRPDGYPDGWFLGKNLFLRGNTKSAVFEEDAFQGHFHKNPMGNNAAGSIGTKYSVPSDVGGTGGADVVIRDAVKGRHGTPRIADETRPINMSVVWIIRVK